MDYIITFPKSSIQLNSAQYKVVTSPLEENQRILASAGSGKTTTITTRIAYLIEEYGIDPSCILLVTFSHAAAEEMQHRIHKLIGHIPKYSGTFHALSNMCLLEKAPQLLTDQPFIDELPYLFVQWMRTEKGRTWAKRFRTVIVDEFQDINEIQWEFVRSFSDATISIVGDDAQNIYTWRGSSVSFILNFHSDVLKVKDYQLCRNYRSTDSIVQICNSVMRFIPTLPFKEKMVADKEGGHRPEVHFFFRSTDEYDWIVNSIHRLRKEYPTFTIAVISRYNSDLYRIEEQLHNKRIPYTMNSDLSVTSLQNDTVTAVVAINRVTLTTIHSSKGLEWDIVFFMNLHDDIFPSRKNAADIVCERRLFYVGITRAKKGLFMSYSRNERSLSRFVREIPRRLLQFSNVTSFKLSTSESVHTEKSIDEMFRGCDGKDWFLLRQNNHLPQIKKSVVNAIYQFNELFSIPEWVITNRLENTWFELLRQVTLRECAIHMNCFDQLLTPEINEALFTIRICKEDIEFWELYEAEILHIIENNNGLTSNIEYGDLETYVTTTLSPHLTWTVKDITQCITILAKINRQLKSFKGIPLNKLSFGLVRNTVPSEFRSDVLKSWSNFANRDLKSHEILGDIWHVASIRSIIAGRNIPLYQYHTVQPFLLHTDSQNQVLAIERSIPRWIVSQPNPSFNFVFEAEGIKPIHFDIITDKCAYLIFFDPKYIPNTEDKILLLLKQYIYEEIFGKSLDTIGFINIATGHIIEYTVCSTIREQLIQLWLHLQTKYHL
jgi:hypothetical protein